jgi:hypothetical protein
MSKRMKIMKIRKQERLNTIIRTMTLSIIFREKPDLWMIDAIYKMRYILACWQNTINPVKYSGVFWKFFRAI